MSNGEKDDTAGPDGRKYVVLSVIPHITGALSALGSSFIAIDIIRLSRRDKKTTVYQRLLFSLSIADIIASVAIALSTIPIPADSTTNYYPYGASGNQATCTAQGFFLQLGGLAVVLYSAALSVYFLCVVRYGKQERELVLMERCSHAIVCTLAVATSFAGLGLDLYNSATLWCWIAPYPLHCATGSSDKNDADADATVVPCRRGNHAWVFRIVFYFIWLWSAMLVVVFSMGGVIHKVWSQWRTMKNRHGSFYRSSAQERTLHRVAVQAVLYVAGFLVTGIWPSVVRMIQATTHTVATDYYGLAVTLVIFFPLQGVWHFFIYLRPRYLHHSRSSRRESRLSSLMKYVRERLLRSSVLGMRHRSSGAQESGECRDCDDQLRGGGQSPLEEHASTDPPLDAVASKSGVLVQEE